MGRLFYAELALNTGLKLRTGRGVGGGGGSGHGKDIRVQVNDSIVS